MASQVKFPKSEEELDKLKYKPDGTPIESSKAKFWRKMTEQPLVPIGEYTSPCDDCILRLIDVLAFPSLVVTGSLLTCGALVIASHHLRTGNRAQFQKALRWRVGLQGLTVVAAVGGTFYLGSGKPAESNTGSGDVTGIATIPGRPATVHQAQRAEERREAERISLKERLRQAEIQTERDEQKRAEEALLRPAERQRPVIGKDGRDRSVKV